MRLINSLLDGRGGRFRPPAVFALFLQKSSNKQYLKLLDFSYNVVGNMSVKKEILKIFLDTFLGAFFETTIMQNLDEIFSLTLKVLNLTLFFKICPIACCFVPLWTLVGPFRGHLGYNFLNNFFLILLCEASNPGKIIVENSFRYFHMKILY